MSAFNILIASCICSNCKNEYPGILQFKYGDCWQHRYQLGESIEWGGNDVGTADVSEVKVYAVLENDECPLCHENNQNAEFDIIVIHDILKKVQAMESYQDYAERDGDYRIVNV